MSFNQRKNNNFNFLELDKFFLLFRFEECSIRPSVTLKQVDRASKEQFEEKF